MKRTIAKLTGKEHFDFFEEELPKLGEHDVLVKTIAVGLCHSEVPTFLGNGTFGQNKHGYMYLETDLQYPITLGHEPVGEVVEVGSEVTEFKPGDYITGCIDPAFADFIVTDENGLVCRIPKTDKPIECCIGEPTMCVTNIAQAVAPVFGDRVAIVGSGFMGLMVQCGLVGRNLKELVAIDLNPKRLELAKKYGATKTINPLEEDVEEAMWEITDGRGFDEVVEITGSLKGFATAVSIVRIAEQGGYFGQGKIVAPSVYARPETWDPHVGYNLMFRSPIVHYVHPWYAPDYRDTLKKAVDGYVKNVYPIQDFITHRFPFESINDGFQALCTNPEGYLKGIITF